jgi:hypothetical protein
MKSATRGLVVGVFFASRVSMAECVDNGGVELGLRIDCVSSLCYKWPANSYGFQRCNNHDDLNGCQDSSCYHYASSIICDSYNCVNTFCINREASLPINSKKYVTQLSPPPQTTPVLAFAQSHGSPKAQSLANIPGTSCPALCITRDKINSPLPAPTNIR